MNPIDEEEEDDGELAIIAVDPFSSVRPPPECCNHYNSNNNICSGKQTSDQSERTKYQTTNRSTSLPSRQTFSSNINTGVNVRHRRRYASDSNKNNKNTTTTLVTSFLQYLRSELRATTNNQKYDHLRIQEKKCAENINYLSQTFNLSNNFYRQQYPIRMSSSTSSSSSSSSQSIGSSSNRLSNENLLKNNFDNSDDNEILKLINLLILRVECLNNENTLNTNRTSPTIRQIDQNLIEYLYYLFNKFIDDNPDSSTPMIDKSNFVSVCQTLVRNGSFNIPSPISPDQSFSETTITNSNDLTSTLTLVHDYKPTTDDIPLENSPVDEQISSELTNDQDAWFIIDLEASTSQYLDTSPDEFNCLLQSSTSDDQYLLPNENYLSFDELKSCESESSLSNYYSPNSSLVDFQSMVQEFDETNNTNNNNNTLFNEDRSQSIEHASNNTNVTVDAKNITTTTSNNNICTGLTNDCEHIESSFSSMESTESMTMKQNEKINRREKKLQERWTITTKNDNNNSDQLPTKTFLGVEFPPIAVLRRKFSSLPSPPILNPLPIKRKDSSSIKIKPLINTPSEDNIDKSTDNTSSTLLKSSMSLPNQEINTSVSDKTKHDQVLDLQSNDTLLLNDCKTNDVQQPSTIITDEKIVHEDMTKETVEEPILLSLECQNETIINVNNTELITESCTSSSPSFCLLSISSSLTTNVNENESIEFVPKETEEEEEKKEEEHCDDDNVDVEKKNNCNIEQNDHASGTILINGEPTQAVIFEQEKKENEEEQETEQPSSPLPTSEPCNQSQPEDESSISTLSNKLDEMTMKIIDENEQRYKTIEIEEISDEENDLSIKNNNNIIEPTDFILTDDELKISRQSSSQSNIKTTNDIPVKVDPVISCYEKALSNAVEKVDESIKLPNVPSKERQLPPIIKRRHRPEDDPIALRALERFEQSMNAAAAKTSIDETSPLPTKGKSSWSGTLSSPRKSLENLLNTNQPLQSSSTSNDEESTTTTLSPQRDSFIRPRKTILDDIGLNFGMTLNLFGPTQSNSTNNNDNNNKLEEQQQPTAIIEGDNKPIVLDESTINLINFEDPQQQEDQPMSINSSMTNESSFSNEADNSNSLTTPSLDNSSSLAGPSLDNLSTNSSLNTVISPLSSEQQTVSPYHLQLDGRRRLNTLEQVRERHQNNESNDLPQQQEQFQDQYTVKPEYLQDPIIRRALERFDEKSRSLVQTKSHYYDDIQDPITRRALMRLDTNLKRTIPPNLPPTHNELNERWYTNSYTLGSLQTNHGQRYPDSSLPPTPNNKPSHVSIHQRFCSTSSDMPELSANNIFLNNESDIPTMRVPAQPVYVTSNNQQQVSVRQRSRSEDMLSSRDLSLGQTTNLDENDTSQLQRNHSSDELQQQQQVEEQQQQQEETTSTNEVVPNETDLQLPNPIVKSLDPNFVRTTEASVNYTTPTQSYSGYSCEYTRPRQNQLITSSKPELSPRNLQQENEIQYTTPTLSAFTPVHPITNNNSYSQQPLSTPSYGSMYTSNNPNQTPYSDDPIVRRALERFNCQIQNSLLNMSQHQPNMNNLSRQFSHGYPHQQNMELFQPTDPHQYDPWMNSHRPMPPTSNTNAGYQSIIGRRRQIRHDDVYHDNTNIGNGYSSSLFINSQNSYPYMNYSDEPPIIPPRLHRDIYHEQPEYISDNVNNNNNNNMAYIHHAYPTAINGFHPFIPTDCYQQFQEEEYLRHRAQSTSSNTSSDSVNPSRYVQQRLPSTIARANLQKNRNILPDYPQLPLDETISNNDSTSGDSVFHRLAYTATKSSLSKSSSNLCANLLNKPHQQPHKPNNIKPTEINDDDESTVNNENNQETNSTLINKCQRSRSVDGRARIKIAQTRANNSTRPTNDDDDNHSTTVPSSKFTSINPRRDIPPPRIPIIPRSSTVSDRPSLTKRVYNGNNSLSTKNVNGTRTRGSSGNLIDTENDENLVFNDNYQPKIIDHKTRIAIPVQRYTNNIQTSASTTSVNSTYSRTKVPVSTSTNLLSPNGQRRNIPVSVFAPAKIETKRSIAVLSSSTSPTNDSNVTNNTELQQQQEQQTSNLSPSSTGDSSYTTIDNENEMNNKLSSTNPALKSSTGDILNELSLANDKHDTNKKMNVFERLFRGHKKKV